MHESPQVTEKNLFILFFFPWVLQIGYYQVGIFVGKIAELGIYQHLVDVASHPIHPQTFIASHNKEQGHGYETFALSRDGNDSTVRLGILRTGSK